MIGQFKTQIEDLFKLKEKLNEEFEKIKAQSTKEHDEMKRIDFSMDPNENHEKSWIFFLDPDPLKKEWIQTKNHEKI